MTLSQLIDRLEEYRNELGDDAEVRLMTQQNYPFENAVSGVTSGAEINSVEEDDEEDVEHDQVVYLVEGQQLCYGSGRAWELAY